MEKELFNAAAPIAPKAKPFMWNPKGEGLQQIKYLKDLKLKEMSQKAGLPSGSMLNTTVFLGNFWGFVNYLNTSYDGKFTWLRVYIAIKPSNEIALIFAPVDKDAPGKDQKYYHLPKNFDPANVADFELSIDEKDLWTENFIKAMALTTIGTNHPDNQFPSDNDAHKVGSDTRYITYCIQDIHELMTVKDYFVSKGFDISNSLNGYLGCYSLNGAPRGKFKGRFVNRIVIQFDFVNGNNKEFYLDDIQEFDELPDAQDSACLSSLLDNGQLCPTYCPK